MPDAAALQPSSDPTGPVPAARGRRRPGEPSSLRCDGLHVGGGGSDSRCSIVPDAISTSADTATTGNPAPAEPQN